MTWLRTHAVQIGIGVVLVLAGLSGAFVAVALSAGQAVTPQRTVTINAGQGPTGPAGTQGPKGEPGVVGPTGPAGVGGAESCPSGSTFGKIVVNTPGGHVEFLTCIVD